MSKANDEDFVAQYTAERSKNNPDFPGLVEAAKQRREFMRKMAARREKLGKSQTQVAAAMQTSPSVISRLESGGNVTINTLTNYFSVLDMQLIFKAVPNPR